jgi:hypothetical protein
LIFILILLGSKLLCAELDISLVFDEAKKNLKRIDFILSNMGYSTGANVDADLFYVDSTGKKVKENIGFGKVVANSHLHTYDLIRCTI